MKLFMSGKMLKKSWGSKNQAVSFEAYAIQSIVQQLFTAADIK